MKLNMYYLIIFINFITICIIELLIIKYSRLEYSYFINFIKIVLFFLIADFFSYWYHIFVHRLHPVIKNYIHEYHHKKDTMWFLDTINVTTIEIIITTIITYIIPHFIINPNMNEFIFIQIIVITHQFYIHSSFTYKYPIPYFISSKYHEKHHKIGGGNYGLFFEFWDYIMGTAIPKKIRKKRKIFKKTKVNDKNN